MLETKLGLFVLEYNTLPAVLILNVTPALSPIKLLLSNHPVEFCTPLILYRAYLLPEVAIKVTDKSALKARTEALANESPVTACAGKISLPAVNVTSLRISPVFGVQLIPLTIRLDELILVVNKLGIVPKTAERFPEVTADRVAVPVTFNAAAVAPVVAIRTASV